MLHTCKWLLIVVVIVSGFASCDAPRYVYSAPTQNIPLLLRKNDFSVAGFVAAGSGSSASPRFDQGYKRAYDFQLAYAPLKNIGVILNAFDRKELQISPADNYNTDVNLKYGRQLMEYGIGYLFPQHQNPKTHFQLFGGFGTGRFTIDENGLNNSVAYTRFHYSNISRLFVQPQVLLTINHFTVAFSTRFCSVKYHHIVTDYNIDEQETFFLKNLALSPVYFWEPATDFAFDVLPRGGLKIEAQGGLVALLNRRFVDYRTLNFAIGLKIDQQLFQKKLPSKKAADPSQ